MFPVFIVSFLFLKLINTLVVQVDLQRFRPEFRLYDIPFDNATTVYDPS